MQEKHCRHFLSYSGIKLPLNLVSPLQAGEEDNRNTFYRGYYDDTERLVRCEKVVYGEVEMEHRYYYGADGDLQCAEIFEQGEDEPQVIQFNSPEMA